MNLLTPDPGLLFWMVLSFLIVFFLLAKFGFPIIVNAINKRKEFIESSLISAKEANEKLATIQEEGERLLAEAKAQQKEIISSAMQEKQKILQAAQDEARTSAQQIVDDAAARIAAEKGKALLQRALLSLVQRLPDGRQRCQKQRELRALAFVLEPRDKRL